MKNSKSLAKIIGPTIMMMSLSEIINYHIWVTNIPPVTYLNGILLFVLGIYIVNVHNYWIHNWTILITLIGWLSIFFGLFRVFFPYSKQAPSNLATYLGLFFLIVVGLFLTLKAYSHDAI
jgi:hypothetical protein